EPLDPSRFHHDNDGSAHPAVRTGAAPDRIEAVAERRLEAHRAAMALTSPNGRLACHVVRISSLVWICEEKMLIDCILSGISFALDFLRLSSRF
ncbi:MAG: hypothetical protein ACRYG8_43605, partial [Janthinobacterium lividum]